MELPFVIVFEPPRGADLAGLLRGRRGRPPGWVLPLLLAVGLIAGGWWTALGAGAGGEGSGSVRPVTLAVGSRPPGAWVTVDGHEQGRTPTSVLVAPGWHEVVLGTADALEGRYRLQVDAGETRLEAALWRRQATVTRVRPTLPGATLASVDALDDGRLALGVAVPPDGALQGWLLEPVGGGLERLPVHVAAGRLAVAPDATRVAWLAPGATAEIGPSMVWLSRLETDQPALVWRTPSPRERLLDLSWAPDGQRLLAASSEELSNGGLRSRLWLLDLAPSSASDASQVTARALVTLPSLLVQGSFVWSRDGQRVAFLARLGGQRALCLLDVSEAEFRYLADLDTLDTLDTPAARLPFPPLAWSADGHRLLFVAGAQDAPAGPFGWLERPRRLVYRVGSDDLVAHPVGRTDADLAAWREDGSSVVLLARLKDDGPLVLRSADASLGQVSHLLELPLRPSAFAARWDPLHARLLLASPGSGALDTLDYTLVRLGLEEED